METPKYFDPKNTINLFGFTDQFNYLEALYFKKKFPKVLMLSGVKGIGKSTLLNHLLLSIYDKANYDKKNFKILETSRLLKQFQNNIFQNILYLNGSEFRSIKVEDIRNLKNNILKSTISNEDRFIVLDDIELFNINSLNALLKIIEEPSQSNYFILINNRAKPILETIKSRVLEFQIMLKENQRLDIIENLVTNYNIEKILDPNESKLSPGNFLRFNYVFKEYNLSIKEDFLKNFSILLNLYKKNKDILFINVLSHLADVYFKDLKDKNIIDFDQIYENKTFLQENLHKYITLNLSQNSLINAINSKFNHD